MQQTVECSDSQTKPIAQGQSNGRRLSRLQIDLVVARTAAKQLGLVTALQLSNLGVTAEHLERRARLGSLHREVRTVYRVPSQLPTQFQFILSRCFAIPDSVIGGFAAAIVHGLPVHRSSLLMKKRAIETRHRSEQSARLDRSVPSGLFGYIPVELHVGPGRTAHLPGAKIRRVEHREPVEEWHGGLVTTVSQTLLDLARLMDRGALSRCLDHTIAEQRTTVASLQELVDERPRAVNRQELLGLLLERPTGAVRHRSRIEQTVGRWLDDARVGQFVPNFIVPGVGVEVDFAWVNQRVALEVSPFYTHGSEAKQERDMERRRLLRAAGWIVIECTDCHLTSTSAFAPILTDLRASLLEPVELGVR